MVLIETISSIIEEYSSLISMFFAMIPPLFILISVYHFANIKTIQVKFLSIFALIIGMIIVLPIALIEYQAIPDGLSTTVLGVIFSNFGVVATVEELGKLIIVYYIFKYFPSIRKPHYVILVALAGSTGFAFIENIIYVLDGGIETAILRAFSSIPMHAATAIIIGFFGCREELGNMKNGWIIGYLIAVFMHGLYNTYAMLLNHATPLFSGVFVIALFYFLVAVILLKYSKDWSDRIDKEREVLSLSEPVILYLPEPIEEDKREED